LQDALLGRRVFRQIGLRLRGDLRLAVAVERDDEGLPGLLQIGGVGFPGGRGLDLPGLQRRQVIGQAVVDSGLRLLGLRGRQNGLDRAARARGGSDGAEQSARVIAELAIAGSRFRPPLSCAPRINRR